MKIDKKYIQLINDPSAVKILSTVSKSGIPHVVVKQSIHYEDGKIVYLERLEGSKTNKHMTYSLWFNKMVAINVLSKDKMSIQIKGVPEKMLVAGSVFEKYYTSVNKKDSGDLAALYYINIKEVIDESYEIREQEHTNEFPLYMHIDRLAKSNEYRCI